MYKICKKKKILGFAITKKYNRRHHIMSIGVYKKFRNKGLGTKLIDKLKSDDNDEISLYVQTINTHAIDFYIKKGFKKLKEVENYYNSLENKNAYYFSYTKY